MSLRLAEVLNGWGTSLAILLAGVLIGWFARTVLFRFLRRVARRTPPRADDLLLEATRRFWLPAIVLMAVLPAARVAPLELEYRLLLSRTALTLLLIGITLAASRFVRLWFATAEAPTEGQQPRPSLIQQVAQGAVIVAGTLLVLDNAGVEITTLLTALGVGSIAVALALQPTLSNLFAGLFLSVSKPIRVGDFIELEDGTQGHVEDIGWRSTRIRQLANNLVFVPNARLSDMRLMNFSLPELPQGVMVRVGVALGSDLKRVESATDEVARALQRESAAADPRHEPSVRFLALGPTAVEFSVALAAATATDRPALVHEFLIRLWQRFDAEGIEIALPQQVVHLRPPPAAPPPAAG